MSNEYKTVTFTHQNSHSTLLSKYIFQDFYHFLTFSDILPSLSYSFIDQTVQPGPLVSLKCSASGNPTPRVTWTLDGYPLPTNDRYFRFPYFSRIYILGRAYILLYIVRFMIGQYVTVHGDVISHLNISSVKVEDGGLYGCEATNRYKDLHKSP